MKVKEMIEWLQKQDQDREVALWEYKKDKSFFYSLVPTATPEANTTNLVCLMDSQRIKPLRSSKSKTQED